MVLPNARRFALLACLVALVGCAPEAKALPGFRPLETAGRETDSYARARVLAMELVSRAAPRMGARDARMAARVVNALGRARFLASSSGRSRETCSTRNFSLFVNVRFPDTIFLCDEVRPHARRGGDDAINRLAQGFVHEAVHLAGEISECSATRFEIAVMDLTIGVRSNGSQIRYGQECRGAW